MDNTNNYNSNNSSNNNSSTNNNNNNENNNNNNENNSSDDFIENVNSHSMNSILNCPSSPSMIMERRSSLPNEFQSIKEMAKPKRKTKKPITTATTTTTPATPPHPKRDHSAPISVHSSKAKLQNSSSDFNFINGNNLNNNNNNTHVNHNNNSKNNKNHFKNELNIYNQQQQQQLAQQYGQQLTNNNGYILIDEINENKEELSPGDFNDENLNEHSELIFDFKSTYGLDEQEVADHFMRKSEQEIEKLKGENFELKNVINAMKQQLHQIQIMQNSNTITNDLHSIMSNNDDNKQILLNKQIISLQEELIRVKLQLDQSQRLRTNELKKRNNENSASSNSANSSYNNEPTKKNLIEQNANLLSELSKLRASEAVLRDTLETERTKVSNLNERNFELTQKLYEYELNDNGVNAALTSNPPKVIIGGTKNETLYQEILTKLKAQGFDDTTNYQEVIICLYQQRSSALKQLNELLFYMKQLNINCNDPVQGMQKLFEEFKSYKNEIEYLNNKINTMKLEIEYQQIEYTNQIKQLLEERDNLLNNINESDLVVNNNNNNNNISNDSNNNIVNHKRQNIILNGNDNPNPTTYKITYNYLNNRRENSDSLIGNYDNNSTENFYLNDETQIEDQQQFENSYNDNPDNDQQRGGHYRSSFQVITTKTYQLPSNINEPIENLDDEDDDEEEDEYIEENQKMYKKETVKNQNYNKPQLSDREWKKEKLELVNANEQLTFKIGALEDQLHKSNENLKTMTTQHEQNVQYLNEQISHYKVENEKQKQELNDQRTKYKMKASDLKRKIEQYERDIAETSKQFNKYQIEIEKLKLDLNFKMEENKKLQKEIDEYAEYKTKCYQLEEKLNSEIRNNQNLQNKIMQLEQNLFNVQVNATKKEDTNMSSEKIIDNLKEIIKEQINSNRGHSAIDIEEYKLKVHELHMKLSHEKLLKESLEIKLKLIEQDNQNLRQTLLSNTKKFANNNEKVTKNRIEEINELIEKAQLNAQNLIASNPNMTANLLETK